MTQTRVSIRVLCNTRLKLTAPMEAGGALKTPCGKREPLASRLPLLDHSLGELSSRDFSPSRELTAPSHASSGVTGSVYPSRGDKSSKAG